MLRKISLRIPKSQWNDLKEILAISEEGFKSLESQLLGALPTSDVEDLAEMCSKQSGISANQIESILRVLMSLNTYKRDTGKSAKEILDEVKNYLSQNDFSEDWEEEYSKKWEVKSPMLINLLSNSRAIEVMSKARDVLYDFQAILLDAKVFTDIRQIFDNEALKIEGSLVIHTLSLEYIENREPKQVHVMLSAKDIENLITKLQRASKKASTSIENLNSTNTPDLTPRKNI